MPAITSAPVEPAEPAQPAGTAAAGIFHAYHPPRPPTPPAPAGPAEPPPPGAPPLPPHPWGALVTSCLVLFLIGVNTTAINTAVTAIADDLSVRASVLGWALNAYLLAVAAFVVLGGELGDLLGRQRVMVAGLAVYAASSAVVASADSGIVLLAGRALQGGGAAILMPATMAVLREAFPKERQGLVLGIWGAVGGVAFAVGPLIGGFFTDELSWRWVWWSSLVVTAVAAVLSLVFLRAFPRPTRRPHFDLVGAALLAGSIFALVVGLQQGKAWGWSSVETIGTFVGSAVLLAMFVAFELRVDRPLVHLRLFRERVFVGANVGTFVNAVGLIGILYFFNLYAQASVLFDDSALKASVELLPYGSAVFVASLVSGRVCDRVGFRWPITVGLLLMAAGGLLLGRVDAASTYADVWWPTAIFGLGVGVTFSSPSAAGLRAVPPDEAGEASGLINVSRYVGAAIVVAVGGVLFVSVGLDRLNTQLDAAGVAAPEQAVLDGALTGSPSQVSSATAGLGAADRQAFETGARIGIANGFAATGILMGAVALAAAALWACLLRPARGPSRVVAHG